MAFYPQEVNKRFESPRNAGASGAGAAGKSASFMCGSFVELSVEINADRRSIEGAKFRTNGCGFMIAAADALCDWLRARALSELHGLRDDELWRAISAELGAFPPDRAQCARVAFEALHSAMSLHRARRIEEFQGESALICTCFGVSEESVVSAISENGFTEVEQVAEACRAGSGCGSCRFLIQELIDMRAGGFA